MGKSPRDLALGPSDARLFVSNAESATVSVIDVAAKSVVADVATGERPVHTYLRPGAAEVWVGNDSAGSASAISTEQPSELARIATGPGHHKIAFTPDGRRAVVSNMTDRLDGDPCRLRC